MFCVHCEKAIPDGSSPCPFCGRDPRGEEGRDASSTSPQGGVTNFGEEEGAVVYAAPSPASASVQAPTSKAVRPRKIPKVVWVVVAVVLVAIVAFVAVGESGKSSLKNDLTRTWYASDNSIIKVLEVDDSTMTYRLETGYSRLDSTIGSWKWRPTGPDSFEIDFSNSGNWTKHRVEFSSNKEGIVVKPALTSTDESEIWVDIS